MELVEGVSFLEHVQDAAPPSPREAAERASALSRSLQRTEPAPLVLDEAHGEDETLAQRRQSGVSAAVRADDQRFATPAASVLAAPALLERRVLVADFGRLRAALRQLVEGLRALHAAGKLHRDVKPSNVLVTREERVVLVDFGLVEDWTPGRAVGRVVRDVIFGTPDYMAPEQAAGLAATPASDFYAVGVVLYEALTGRRTAAAP